MAPSCPFPSPAVADAVASHCANLRAFGFSIIPNVIPVRDVPDVRADCLQASATIRGRHTSTTRSTGSAAAAAGEERRRLAQDVLQRHGLLPPRDSHPPASAGGPGLEVEEHNRRLNCAADKLLTQHGVTDVHPDDVPTGAEQPGLSDLAFLGRPGQFGAYLANPVVVGVAQAMLDPHVRVAQLEIPKSIDSAVSIDRAANGPWFGDGEHDRRHWHSDWPH
eukprot:SAG31_NODE_2287_length_6004_cov_2.142954_6_plen_220_part_01